MKIHTIDIEYIEFESLEELTDCDKSLIVRAREASQGAWAPYSGFRVGAAVLLVNGEIIIGNNQENAAYPSGLCAERVALYSANANFPSVAVEAIAISASDSNELVESPITPCGSCRQSMLESETRFNHPVRLLLDSKQSLLSIVGIKHLLPLSFGG